MVFSSSKRRIMLALVDLSRFCKLDRSCSAVHELPVAAQIFDFGSALWASVALGFTCFTDLDDFSPIFEAAAPSTPSQDIESTFARFIDAFVVVAFAFVRFVAVFFCAKSISLSSSEEIVWFTAVFGNFLLVLVGVAFLIAIFSLDILQTIEQIRCSARRNRLQFALTFFFSMAMARHFRYRFCWIYCFSHLPHCPTKSRPIWLHDAVSLAPLT